MTSKDEKTSNDADVMVVGAGHNGLVCALLLARSGLRVRVLEDKSSVGGAAKTERPFARAPGLGTSTGAYLLGLMPPELMTKLGIALPLRRRDPHYFLPTTGDRYLCFGADEAATKEQFLRFFSAADYRAHRAMQTELAALRDDIAPTWLSEPLSIEDTADRYVRAPLRRAFVDLCRGPVGDYLERWGFESDLVKAMYAVTDGFSGLCGTWDTPGTGNNFLVHNMGRLPGADGTWMIVAGGMGKVTETLADEARREGAIIATNARVRSIVVEARVARGVLTDDGVLHRAKVVVCNADPERMRGLVASDAWGDAYHARLDGYRRDGTTLKVNLALKGLPTFRCWPEGAFSRPGFGPTIHLLPDEADVLRALRDGFAATQRGELAESPTIEWYVHTTVDPSLQDDHGHHNAALFVQWVPYALKGTTWDAAEPGYVKHLLSICDRFAPGTSDLVVDTFTLNPQAIERHFGISRGHIHHVDNGFGFADRLPYATPIEGLYSCSAGCHPAGSVIGAAGHNAAARVLREMGIGNRST